jgi:D-beta-D-heptose 7-phosphate kinase/D-beta-D-heptose 1-phosphate adenosyltransferase
LTANALNFLKKLEKARVLCLGDLMLDRYIYGEASRLSPEAPVPVISVRRKIVMPGGLGNVIMNLRSIGSTALTVGLTGDDVNALELSKLLITDKTK